MKISWFNIRISSCQYRKFRRGDKTILLTSYLHGEFAYTDDIFTLNEGPKNPLPNVKTGYGTGVTPHQ